MYHTTVMFYACTYSIAQKQCRSCLRSIECVAFKSIEQPEVACAEANVFIEIYNH